MTIDLAIILQFVKYAVAGGVATLTHIVLFHLVAWKMFPALQEHDHLVRLFKIPVTIVDRGTRAKNSMIGNGFAFLFSNLVAYVLNIAWVFEQGRHHFLIEIALFYLVSGVSALAGTALMGFLIKRFNLLTSYAFMANLVVVVMVNYVVRKYVIFLG